MNAPAVGYGYIPPPPTSGVAAYEEDCKEFLQSVINEAKDCQKWETF